MACRFLSHLSLMVREQAFFDRPVPDLPARMHAELEHNVVDMRFDGPFADHQLLGDFTVDSPPRNQGGYLALACRQPSKGFPGSTARCQRAFLGQHGRGLREEVRAHLVAMADDPNAFPQAARSTRRYTSLLVEIAKLRGVLSQSSG